MQQSELPKCASKPKLTSIPSDITCVADYEALAKDYIDTPVYEYIAGGSGNEQSLRANIEAFQSVQLVNRLLVDCSAGTTATQLLGQSFRHPVLLAPVAYQKLVHPLGELETARAAEALDTCMVTSTLSSCTLEEIAQAHQGNRWFQLYFQVDRAHTLDLVRRAEAAGYSALMVTLDASIQASNRRAKRAGFQFPTAVRPENLQRYQPPQQVTLSTDQSVIFQGAMAEAPGWSDLEWLLANTSLPVLVKGVLHPNDAKQLAAMGVSGVVVSNHGGRALDGVPSAVHVLPQIRAALGKDVTVLADGGVRSGYDVFKLLALGADAVMVGRPLLYGLAVAGALGVAHILRMLRDELEVCMALTGCPTLQEIDRQCLWHSEQETNQHAHRD
ncbi:alpha-hydroxy acid oxidase [Ketobacter alkanivorans]|uniref:Alpha-hydroxy-acid oxidizing enzyme n=1 Tax=Ketobacter alkanivorans TaxID=1917421 RepID=A0A2K9LJE0_9GAMM|nr:alpha-hydroxy acid oxidase [Ketobacter alkanivorans]AUM12479.1 alpha-hydroxy-acid oxidizing enzyme [Ketobacter alkanivorans]